MSRFFSAAMEKDTLCPGPTLSCLSMSFLVLPWAFWFCRQLLLKVILGSWLNYNWGYGTSRNSKWDFFFMSILLSQLRLYFLNILQVSFPWSFIFDSNANPWVTERPSSVLHQSFNINYSIVVVCCTSVAFCKNLATVKDKTSKLLAFADQRHHQG